MSLNPFSEYSWPIGYQQAIHRISNALGGDTNSLLIETGAITGFPPRQIFNRRSSQERRSREKNGDATSLMSRKELLVGLIGIERWSCALRWSIVLTSAMADASALVAHQCRQGGSP